jgi:hypothetical protein
MRSTMATPKSERPPSILSVPLSQAVERVHVVERPEVLGVLHPDEHPDASRAMHRRQVRSRVDAHEDVWSVGDDGVVGAHEGQHVLVRLLGAPSSHARGDVEYVDLGVPELTDVGFGEALQPSTPPLLRLLVEGEQAQHVDDQRSTDQVDAAVRVGGLAPREQLVAFNVQEGSEHGGTGRTGGPLQQAPTRETHGCASLKCRDLWLVAASAPARLIHRPRW